MAEVVVLGAGLSGTIMAYELKAQLRKGDKLSVIGQGERYHFVPSNPWVAVGWRSADDISIDLPSVMTRKGIRYYPQGAKRVHAAENRVELEDGKSVAYDYLVICTGPELAFDEIEGLGPEANTQSICHVDHAEAAKEAFEKFAKAPGPIVVGAVQGASCFGPAYEFAFILDTELRRRKMRDKVPMTFVTTEPYIGHLGLDGVGDTKGLLESEMREHHIKWITNARVKGIAAGKMTVEEVGDDGQVKKTHELPFAYSMMLPAFRGVSRGARHRGAGQPARLRHRRQAPAQSEVQERVQRRRLRGDRAAGGNAGADRRAEDRLHDRIHGDGDRAEHRPAAAWARSRTPSRPGTRCVLPISATAAWRSWRSRRSRRATSTGPRKAPGCTTPRSASRSISCARSGRARASRSTRSSSWTSSTCARSRK